MYKIPYGEAHFYRGKLTDVRVIMAIMRVPVEELLHQVAMGRILVLKYLQSGVHGHLWPCPVIPGIKYLCFLRTRLHWRLPGTESPRSWLLGTWVC
jgi:hypothetical protein